ncbi:MAG: VCBS repeat-containing protein, partial [Bdellovibrionales bacterium]|nr:VCBS repeat-containing protein [Bdellovibrionales bacterium]
MTSLISRKYSSCFLLALVILFGVSCADKKIRPIKDIPPSELSEQDTNHPKEIITYNGEPNTAGIDGFKDLTKEYGLDGIEAVHLYAVDVNNDGATDLVTLDDFSSAPKFYFFNKKEKKFKHGDNPFSETVRASYLNFVDLDHDGILDVIVGNLNQKSEMTQYPPRIYKGVVANKVLSYELKTTLP